MFTSDKLCCYLLLGLFVAAGVACQRSEPSPDPSTAETDVPVVPNQAILAEAERMDAWFHAKKTRPIWAKRLEEAQVVQTLEGQENVSPGHYLCRGEAGDIWPQKEAELLKRYAPHGEPDAEGWQQYVPRPDAEGVLAVQIDHPFSVRTSWGQLTGKAGDYLVKNYADREVAQPKDVWIVDQELFAATYERQPQR